VPGGGKPTFLAQHGHEVINSKLPDEDRRRFLVGIIPIPGSPEPSW